MDEATAASRPELRSAVEWRGDHLEAIDQTALPERFTVLELRTVGEVADALRRLVVRGAPAIGVAAAFGVVIGLDERRPATAAAARDALEQVVVELEATRPTAVNLRWGARRVAAAAAAGHDAAAIRQLALDEAMRVLSEDREACRRMADHGRAELAGRRRLLTHCNTGRLATAGLGTALAVVYAKAEAGEPVEVLVSETRPLLQGARLTAWELLDAGIPVTLLADTAAGSRDARDRVHHRRGRAAPALRRLDRAGAGGRAGAPLPFVTFILPFMGLPGCALYSPSPRTDRITEG